jgi:hypothetical protein
MYVEEYIKIPDLKDGYLYKIIARNASYGIWMPDEKSFLISRWKFNENFLFEENHYDCEDFATAQPIEEVEKSPFENIRRVELGKEGHKFMHYDPYLRVLGYLNKFEAK